MKRVVAAALIVVMLLGFSACKKDEGEPATASISPEASDEIVINGEDDDISQIKIGFSLGGEGTFYDQLIVDIEEQCDTYSYEPQIMTADTPEQQEDDILEMLSTGCVVIVLDPVKVDTLETALSECEIQDVPVINIIDQVNGTVNMLISTYYKTVGEKAGGYAVDLLADGGISMMLCTQMNSFIMQLMSDGFAETIGQDSNVALASTPFCGDDEEEAYEQVSEALKGETAVNFVFAQSAVLGRGALRAIEDAKTDTKLVVYGGDMDIIQAVESGGIYAALFMGPGQLAKRVVYHANKFIIDSTYEAPQFVELDIGVVTAENAAEYISDTEEYAEIKNE